MKEEKVAVDLESPDMVVCSRQKVMGQKILAGARMQRYLL